MRIFFPARYISVVLSILLLCSFFFETSMLTVARKINHSGITATSEILVQLSQT